jgi:hypothetical protein
MVKRLAEKGVDVRKIRELRNWTDPNEVAPDDRTNGFRARVLQSSAVVSRAGSLTNYPGRAGTFCAAFRRGRACAGSAAVGNVSRWAAARSADRILLAGRVRKQ